MTAAQKIAKEKFKKAIAYRQKTGVSLKEAFAHVYGKKTVTKKPTKYKSKLTKKWNPIKPTDNVKELKKYGYQLKGVTKKSAKKVGYSKARLKQEKGITKVLRSTPKTLFPYTAEEKIIKAGKKYYDAKAKGLSGVKRKTAKKKKTSEQSILNKIHRVKNEVNKLDEAQHKHMMFGVSKISLDKLEKAISNAAQYKNIINNINRELIIKKGFPSYIIKDLKDTKKTFTAMLKEEKTHITELKKHI